jgi:hypothetical protein
VKDKRDLTPPRDPIGEDFLEQPSVDSTLTPAERQSVRDFLADRNASPEWQLAGRLDAIIGPNLPAEASPADLRRRADDLERRAEMYRSSPDAGYEGHCIATGLDNHAGGLRDSADRQETSEDFLERYEQDPESTRTAALAANAAEVVKKTKGLQPQQGDRRVVGITADATGADRDRHGRTFGVRDMIESSGRTINVGDPAQLTNVETSRSVRRGMSR